jgi:queuine tRNA-ribosyltransferase
VTNPNPDTATQPSVRFELVATDPASAARAGLLHTPHGAVETPVFMPVGTQATVKGLTVDLLHRAGARMLLANTYHLALRPGEDVVALHGGLHRFMNWTGPILTDSGGFQVFSLAARSRLDETGVQFRSHIDGRLLHLSPERAIAIQQALGADVIMCFDHCPALPAAKEAVADATERTLRWAQRCRAAHPPGNQALFGIVQGGPHADLRAACARRLVELGFDGYAIGGVSVGESRDQFQAAVAASTAHLPTNQARYLMGVGRPADLLQGIALGVDMFDCVLPTRNGRNATCLSSKGPVKLRNARYRDDLRPVDEACPCFVCERYSRAYLRHLFLADEMLGPILASSHNIAYLHHLMRQARQAIAAGNYVQFMSETLEGEAATAID